MVSPLVWPRPTCMISTVRGLPSYVRCSTSRLPNVVFDNRLVLHLTYEGKPRTVEIMHVGRGHTKGDTIVWLREDRILYSGDLVEYAATPYTGDAYLRDWPATLDRLQALQPVALVP